MKSLNKLNFDDFDVVFCPLPLSSKFKSQLNKRDQRVCSTAPQKKFARLLSNS